MNGSGYIKLYRKLLSESWVMDLHPVQFKVAVVLLLLANWKDGKGVHRGQEVLIRRGQVARSYDAIARNCRKGVNKEQVRRAVRTLERVRFLDIASDTGLLVLTIRNYDRYQAREDEADTLAARQPTPDRHLTDTNRRREEGKKGRREDPCPDPEGRDGSESDSQISQQKRTSGIEPCPRAYAGVDYLLKRIVEKDPGLPVSKRGLTARQRRSWAQTLDKLHRRDGQSWEDIGKAMRWLFDTENKFVVQSADALRKKFGSIRAGAGLARINGTKRPPEADGMRYADQAPEPTRQETLEEYEARIAREHGIPL